MGRAILVGAVFLALLAGWGIRSRLRRRGRPTGAGRWLPLAPVAVVSLLSVPAVKSCGRNDELIMEGERIDGAVAAIDWQRRPMDQNLAVLDVALGRLRELDRFAMEGPPPGMGWGMYRGDDAYQPALAAYAQALDRGLIEPCRAALAERLASDKGGSYLALRTMLRQYLMLRDPAHLEVGWATNRYASDCPALMRVIPSTGLAMRLQPHLRYYFEQIQHEGLPPAQLDDEVIARARRTLEQAPAFQRYYALFVESLGDERVDELAAPAVANLLLPPVRFDQLFGPPLSPSRGDLQVRGVYTEKGRYAVTRLMLGAEGLLRAEAWVVPLSADDLPDLRRNLLALRTRYEETYIQEWVDFFAGIEVSRPETPMQAITVIDSLLSEPGVYDRVLLLLERHTQWLEPYPFETDDPLMREANDRFLARTDTYLTSSEPAVTADDLVMMTVRHKFANDQGTGPVDFAQSLADYAAVLRKLRDRVAIHQNEWKGAAPFSMDDAAADFQEAQEATAALLSQYDPMTNVLFGSLLRRPVRYPEAAKPARAAPMQWSINPAVVR